MIGPPPPRPRIHDDDRARWRAVREHSGRRVAHATPASAAAAQQRAPRRVGRAREPRPGGPPARDRRRGRLRQDHPDGAGAGGLAAAVGLGVLRPPPAHSRDAAGARGRRGGGGLSRRGDGPAAGRLARRPDGRPRQRDRGHDPRRLRAGAGRRPRARPGPGARHAGPPGVGPAAQRAPGDDRPPRPGHPHLPRGGGRDHRHRRGDARLQLLGGRRAAGGRARGVARDRDRRAAPAHRGVGLGAAAGDEVRWSRGTGPPRLNRRAAFRLPGRRGAGRPSRGASALPARHVGAGAVHAPARGGRLGARGRPRGPARPRGLAPVHRAGGGRLVPLPPSLRGVPAAPPGRARAGAAGGAARARRPGVGGGRRQPGGGAALPGGGRAGRGGPRPGARGRVDGAHTRAPDPGRMAAAHPSRGVASPPSARPRAADLSEWRRARGLRGLGRGDRPPHGGRRGRTGRRCALPVAARDADGGGEPRRAGRAGRAAPPAARWRRPRGGPGAHDRGGRVRHRRQAGRGRGADRGRPRLGGPAGAGAAGSLRRDGARLLPSTTPTAAWTRRCGASRTASAAWSRSRWRSRSCSRPSAGATAP